MYDDKIKTGIGLSDLLLVAFIVLKLVGCINWSWWWVLAPLWIPVSLIATIEIIDIITTRRNQ